LNYRPTQGIKSFLACGFRSPAV